MRRTADLEARLIDWGKAYGGGRYNLSEELKSPLGSMIKWGGRPPSGMGHDAQTPDADKVQDAVEYLAKQTQGWMPANVLRCEYFSSSARLVKIDRLKKFHAGMDPVRFSQNLRLAKIHVAGWLRIPFSDPLTEEEQIAMLDFITRS